MISWSKRRQMVYIGSVLFVFFALFVFYIFTKIYTPATCNDGKKNQDELGIDCGGSCSVLCGIETKPVNIHWSRVFKINKNIFSVFAYIENPNKNAEAKDVPYTVKLYDNNDLLVYSNSGKFNLPAGKMIGLLESNLKLGGRNPVRADFVIDNNAIVWHKENQQILSVYIRGTKLNKELDNFKVKPEIVNRGESNISNLYVIAILYDNFNNAVGVSQTLLSDFTSGSVRAPIFVWPADFLKAPQRVEYLYWSDSTGLTI